MLPWRVFWVLFGAVITALIGGLPVMLHAGAVKAIAATVLVVIPVMAIANVLVSRCDAFQDDVSPAARNHILWLIWAAIVVHAAWIVALQLMPQHRLVMAFVLLALPVVEHAATHAHGFLTTTAVVPRAQNVDDLIDPQPTDDVGRTFAEALRRADMDRLRVGAWEPVGDEADPHGTRFTVTIPAKAAQKAK